MSQGMTILDGPGRARAVAFRRCRAVTDGGRFVKPLALALSFALFGCGESADGGAGGSSGGGLEAGSVASVRVRGDEGLDRGPEGYRLSVVRREEAGLDPLVRRYAYDADGRILVDSFTEEWEILGFYAYDHDAGGRLLSVTEDGGDAVVFRYTDGRVSRIELGRTLFDYRYDAGGRLSGVTLSDVDRDPDGSTGGTVEVTALSDIAYREGRLDSVTVSTPGFEGRQVTRYEYEDGLLTREVTVTDDLESSSRSVSLSRDADGRLATVTRLRASVPQTETTFDYAGNRLLAIRTVPLVRIVDGLSGSIEVLFEYSGLGLIERFSRTFVDGDSGEVSTSVTTFEYENEPCVGQGTARPELALVAELEGILRPVSAALDCGYWLDEVV